MLVKEHICIEMAPLVSENKLVLERYVFSQNLCMLTTGIIVGIIDDYFSMN